MIEGGGGNLKRKNKHGFHILIVILIGSRRMVVRFLLINHSFGKNFTCDSALLQYLHTFESLACSFFILWLSLFSLTSIKKNICLCLYNSFLIYVCFLCHAFFSSFICLYLGPIYHSYPFIFFIPPFNLCFLNLFFFVLFTL